MSEGSIVVINGHEYKYRWNKEAGRMDYLGPVGEAPPLTQEELNQRLRTVLITHGPLTEGKGGKREWNEDDIMFVIEQDIHYPTSSYLSSQLGIPHFYHPLIQERFRIRQAIEGNIITQENRGFGWAIKDLKGKPLATGWESDYRKAFQELAKARKKMKIPLRNVDLQDFFTDYKPKNDRLPGGRGDLVSPLEFEKLQLERGVLVELEHTEDPHIALEIAIDHLAEDSDYYIDVLGKHIKDELLLKR
jgi:hypothetical protein